MYKIIYKKYFNEQIAKGKLMSKYLYPKGIIRKTVIKQNINIVDLHGKLETLVINKNSIFIKDKESYARSVNLNAVILEHKINKKIKIGTLIHTNFCFNNYLNLTKYYTSLSFIKRWKKNTFSSNLKKRNIFIISPNSGGFIIAYCGIIGFIPRSHILPLKLKTQINFNSTEAQKQNAAYKWQIMFNKYKSQFFHLKLTATLQSKKDNVRESFKRRLLRRRKIKVSFVFTNPHRLRRKKKKKPNIKVVKWQTR